MAERTLTNYTIMLPPSSGSGGRAESSTEYSVEDAVRRILFRLNPDLPKSTVLGLAKDMLAKKNYTLVSETPVILENPKPFPNRTSDTDLRQVLEEMQEQGKPGDIAVEPYEDDTEDNEDDDDDRMEKDSSLKPHKITAGLRKTAKKERKVVATVALFRKNNNVVEVLVEGIGESENDEDFHWMLPGGHIDEIEEDMKEDYVTAAVRELEEETGVSVKPQELTYVCVQDRDTKHVKDDILFTGTIPMERSDAEATDEIDFVKWFPIDQLPEMIFNHNLFVERALKRLYTVEQNMPTEIMALPVATKRGFLIVFEGIDGSGKCFAKGTKVMMFDGSSKCVEDIVVADRVMGPDSKPRTVQSLGRGREEMYRVTPKKGAAYEVNSSHILTFKLATQTAYKSFCDGAGILNISVSDFVRQSACFKRHCMGYRANGINFKEVPVKINPYILGIWLGDGNSADVRITNPDEEVIAELRKEAYRRGLTLHTDGILHSISGGAEKNGGIANSNSFKNDLRHYELLNNKHVPEAYKINSKKVRLELLAGLLDSDGHLQCNGYDFVNINKNICDAVVFIARSLGLAAYMKPCKKKCQTGAVGDYFRISISGNTDIIPCRVKRKQATKRGGEKDCLNVGVKVESIGYGDYYGFTLQEDPFFLLSDFTVVHNSTQVDILMSKLKSKGYDLFYSKWASSDLLSDAIKTGKKERRLTPMLYSMLNAADMVTRYEEEILPALADNKVVILDRYIYTSFVRDAIRGTNTSMLNHVYEGFRTPDLMLYCRVPLTIAYQRLAQNKGLAYYGAGLDLHLHTDEGKAAQDYQRLMYERYEEITPAVESCVIVDTSGEIDDIADGIWEVTKENLNQRKGLLTTNE